jgi:ERF superfamily/Protein of unknown function (DUF968)
LSSGLEIVRKSLGQHEIATVQTTAIDEGAGLVRLTTVLAHSSGEWISSEWPVCSVRDTDAPQRMGAALTYARRYALFTLVGIAGEDDLDAPDLLIETSSAGRPNGASAPSQVIGTRVMASGDGRTPRAIVRLTLTTGESASLRERLLAELRKLSNADELARWAQRILPAKNSLWQEDAHAIEQAFEERLRGFPASDVEHQPKVDEEPVAQAPPTGLAIPKTRRRRSKKHLEFVASQPCRVCGRSPSDAHHLGFAQPRALGRKVSDEFTVPLCRSHHRLLHDRGNELAWWEEVEIEPLAIAEQLWRETNATMATRNQEHRDSLNSVDGEAASF